MFSIAGISQYTVAEILICYHTYFNGNGVGMVYAAEWKKLFTCMVLLRCNLIVKCQAKYSKDRRKLLAINCVSVQPCRVLLV